MQRAAIQILLFGMASVAMGQRIDSVHVFRHLPDGSYTSSSANRLVWLMHHDHAEHVSICGAEAERISEALEDHEPEFHRSGKLDDLTYLAMAFVNGRPVAVGILGDLDRVINFTANREFPVHAWPEQELLRATLTELLLGQ